ncbi:hypothetical protein U9M48_029791 [Paspalum notatum var. saurae]|uniref:Uncharacterized protein n=1 Tax=Paspalum notatum var. saurae TaxID=547442 RepID=A0AAQ3U2B0_PASNO
MADRQRSASTLLTRLGIGALTINTALAVYKAWGDAGAVVFVVVAYAAVLLLFHCLRRHQAHTHHMEAKLGFLVLACTSALVVYSYWGDASSVAFVLLADTALLLLFLCLREFERTRRGREDKIKAAVWALTTLLTAMFASRVAPLMPPAVAAVVWAMAVAAAAEGFWALFMYLNP